jgi:hypothetical protein
MRIVIVCLLLIFDFAGTAQPMRLLYSGNVPDSVFYFPELREQLLQTKDYDNQILGMELEGARIRLSLFNEPSFDLTPFELRVCEFSNIGATSQIIRIHRDQNRVLVQCKRELDNTVDLSYFRTEELTKSELKRLSKELKKSRDGIFPEHLQEIVSKSIIQDSLSLKYDEQTFELNQNSLDRLLKGLSDLNLMEPILAEDIITGNVHEYRSLWIIEWKSNGTQRIYIRRSPNNDVKKFMEWGLSKCSEN